MALDKEFVVGEVLSASEVNSYLLSLWKPLDKRIVTSSSPVSSVSFSSLDPSFQTFRLTLDLVPPLGAEFALLFNNDTGTNYRATKIYSTGAAPNILNSDSQTSMNLNVGSYSRMVASLTIGKYGSSTVAGVTGTVIGASSASIGAVSFSGIWKNTSSLINRIDVIDTFSGTFYGVIGLEGLRGA